MDAPVSFNASMHGLHDIRNAFVHLAKAWLPSDRLDEISSLPKGVARLAKRL
jgi:hypothetical protein